MFFSAPHRFRADYTVDWQHRVVNAGSSTGLHTVAATNRYEVAAKVDGWISSMRRINLCCGDNLTACLQPLLNGSGYAADVSNNIIASDYSESVGIQKGNHAPTYLEHFDTGFVPFTVGLLASSGHISVYVRTSWDDNAKGAYTGSQITGNNPRYFVGRTTTLYWDFPTSNAGERCIGAILTSSKGYYIGSRVTMNDTRLYENGVQIAFNATPPNYYNYNNTTSVWFMRLHDSAGPTFGDPQDSHIWAGYTLGFGVAVSDIASMNAAMEEFQVELGRGVA